MILLVLCVVQIKLLSLPTLLVTCRLRSRKDFTPAAAMVYTDLDTLGGLFRPTDYGSGIEYADGILDSVFPDSTVGLQVGKQYNLFVSEWNKMTHEKSHPICC